MEDRAVKDDTQQVFQVLETLKRASERLQTRPTLNSSEPSSIALEALLELETGSDSILSTDPHLRKLSHHLTTLKSIFKTLEESRTRAGIQSFLNRRVSACKISRIAKSIESEIQAWIDRETVFNLNITLQNYLNSSSTSSSLTSFTFQSYQEEENFLDLVDRFRKRLSEGFDRVLQDLILKSRIFKKLESVLWRTIFPRIVRERAAFTIAELIKFNKDVFVGQILMGQSQTVRSLVSMGTASSLQVLRELIKSIKSPLVDDIQTNDEIEKIIQFLSVEDLSICIVAMDCVFEIGYYGRKEAIDALLNAGLIKRLVELQRWSDLFGGCVTRFSVQLNVGEGLRQREKRAFRKEILRRVREASVSDAEAATMIAEVLWGSSP